LGADLFFSKPTENLPAGLLSEILGNELTSDTFLAQALDKVF
jgi:hypothetical protein